MSEEGPHHKPNQRRVGTLGPGPQLDEVAGPQNRTGPELARKGVGANIVAGLSMGERTGIGRSARARLTFGLNALRQIGSDVPEIRADDAQIPGIGHNGGPPLEDPPARSWSHYCWKRAHKAAWKTPGREVALRRLRRAEELGMTYEEYTAIILDRGVFL